MIQHSSPILSLVKVKLIDISSQVSPSMRPLETPVEFAQMGRNRSVQTANYIIQYFLFATDVLGVLFLETILFVDQPP